jgi:uncharacterized protein (TIGR02757 family)
MRRRPVADEVLRARLDALVETFDISTIEPDPLQVVHRFREPRDQEVAGLIAAAFAYGRASIVVANTGTVLARMKPSPFAYVADFDRADAERRFAGFSHRFHKTRELVELLERIAAVTREYGSLGAAFKHAYEATPTSGLGLTAEMMERGRLARAFWDIGGALTRFATIVRGPKPSKALQYLVTSPEDGSACKRMNLFLRWMVRRTSPDLGLWTFVDPAKLVMPVDTHIHRIAHFLGLSDRKSADWKSARIITDSLARFDAADPVRYDFALCRLGILDLCSRNRREENCNVCMLRDVCRFPVVKSKRLDKIEGSNRRRAAAAR